MTDRVDLSAQLLRADAPLPDALRALAARLAPDSRVIPVWRNGLGGLTVRLDPHRARASLILKWSPAGREVALADERARLDWAGRYHPVPRVLDAGEADDGAGGSAEWMLTAALPGDSAVSDRWRADPRTAVRAIGAGLRRLHEALPVAECPFAGPRLDGEPAVEHPVVAHGDACAPNTLLDAEGAFLAHVDLGALGAADRWSDLAIASMSLEWNYGTGWEETFFDAYGIERDERLIRRWRERWNADSEPAGGGGSTVGGSL
ncbi:phosphotransferase [Microcella daejeonensis]|uniref:Phosphotransferase n=1 Tax=Microcella daejeonensis TaxID=2994971 RepID=A0A9E8MK56_9MICO|nr:phosphotransferase [Microcella daejeonensis]WAB81070.1 phosphotransferase [Microcella daejeonensis]